jgi:hypothetical protein
MRAMQYVLAGGAFRILAEGWAKHGVCMTDTAWRLRFLGMKDALAAIVCRMLCDRADFHQEAKLEITTVDGSNVPGPRGKHVQRMHVAMDLESRRLMQLRVTDHHTAEALTQRSVLKASFMI